MVGATVRVVGPGNSVDDTIQDSPGLINFGATSELVLGWALEFDPGSPAAQK